LTLGLLCSLVAFADKPVKPAMTLGDLIVRAKQQQINSLRLNSPSDLPQTSTNKQSKPVLWSLTGVNHQLVAEVLYNQQVHVLRLHDGDRAIGPWVIERYGNNGLQLVLAKNKKVSLYLRPPAPGMTLERYAFDVPNPANAILPGLGVPKSGTLSPVSAQNLGDIMPPNVLSQNNLSQTANTP
jgi:hypothetical protein